MTDKIIGFFIGAGGGLDQPTASIKLLEDRLVLKTFDARPDAEGISPVCFWSSPGPRWFYENRTRQSSSLLPAEPEALDYIQENGLPWRSEAELVRMVEVETETLDGYCQKASLWPEFLSMDIQGAEYEVLKAAPRALEHLLAIITEVEFRQIYQGQKLFADIDTLLRAAKFQFMSLYVPQYWRLHPGDTQRVLTVGEALFLRKPEGLDEAVLSKLAAIARCFGFEGYTQAGE
ncbi:MAG: FkbM family methyltransferase [Pseudomonadota bacterium]|nr:FkbM family methyltransferase [Pseudomonadota bacterium]